jgi:uncharacterized protein YwqG
MTMNSDQVRELIAAVGLEHRASEIMAMLQPASAIHTSPTDESKIAIGESKFGGMPDLPIGVAWPDYQGHPLAFVAQINLADVTPYDHDQWLPVSGHLYFFFDANRYYDDELYKNHGKDSYQVIYSDEDISHLTRAVEPHNLELKYIACRLNFSEILTLPDMDSYWVATVFGWTQDNLFEDEQDKDAYLKLYDQLIHSDSWHNRMFGYPYVIQNDVMLEAEEAAYNLTWDEYSYVQRGDSIKTWQLLLQVDSDDNAGMMWDDVGVLYFCIQAKDLRERRFDAAVFVTQSC